MEGIQVHLTAPAEADYLQVVASGFFSLESAQETFGIVLEGLVQSGRSKVLFLGLDISGEPQIIERFYYGEFVAGRVFEAVKNKQIRRPRFAYVLQPPVRDPGRLGETVAVNRGMNVKSFEDINSAIAWLGGLE